MSASLSVIDPAQAQKRSAFDYSELSADVAEAAQSAARRIRSRLQRAIVETGRDLIDMKARLGHGHFTAWISAEFGGMSLRTAQAYMSAARTLGDKSATVAHLPIRTVLNLGAKSTPQAARDQVVARVEAGEVVRAPQVAAIISEAKAAERPACVTYRVASEAPRQPAVPFRVLSAADLSVRPGRVPANAVRTVLNEFDLNGDGLDIRSLWDWSREKVARQRTEMEGAEELTATHRRDLSALEDVHDLLDRLVQLVAPRRYT